MVHSEFHLTPDSPDVGFFFKDFEFVPCVNGVEDIINQKGHQVHYTKKWSYGEFLFFHRVSGITSSSG